MGAAWKRTGLLAHVWLVGAVAAAEEGGLPPPLTQSSLPAHRSEPLELRDAVRDDRWLGVPPRDVVWAPDSKTLYFRYSLEPAPSDDPAADRWYGFDLESGLVQRLEESSTWKVPAADITWSDGGRRAAWVRDGRLVVYDARREVSAQTFVALATDMAARSPRMDADGSSVQFQLGEDLYEYRLDPCPQDREGCARLQQLSRKARVEKPGGDAARWLERQQLDLFELARRRERDEEDRERRERSAVDTCVHTLRVAEGLALDRVGRSPDGRWLTLRAVRAAPPSSSTTVLSYVNRSGYSEVERARPKVGEPQGESRLGFVTLQSERGPVCESVVTFDQADDSQDAIPEDEAEAATRPRVTWWSLPEQPERAPVPHGPYWSHDGRRALAQFISADHQDLWIVELGFGGEGSGGVVELVHDHDDAWLGGPPIQANYWRPALLEWLEDGSFAFASERTGWSHLYRYSNGGIVPLTEGPWEVRQATSSLDRTEWLLETSREHPSDDHLYTLPTDVPTDVPTNVPANASASVPLTGGELRRLTEGAGRHNGWRSPDGRWLALLESDSVTLPDLYLVDLDGGTPAAGVETEALRLTRSGTDAYRRHRLRRPETVSFAHPDGKPIHAALYRPEEAHPLRPAILHIHGGGYRQFTHHGWSVYGYETHLGLLNYLVQEGYTVLDFDYRGSSGYGRDYRTDIYKSMGHKDIDGAVAAVDWLVENEGIDPRRVGIYGISYGGFFTLMAQFRHPGRFAAGVAIASVTDWAHYNHPWTSRVLGLPYDDPEAYRRSSPIEHAEGLEDSLLIVHGLLDENVQFQDAARLTRKLIELEKPFELMVYPAERHVIEDEATRLDFARRLVSFFARELLGEHRAAPSELR